MLGLSHILVHRENNITLFTFNPLKDCDEEKSLFELSAFTFGLNSLVETLYKRFRFCLLSVYLLYIWAPISFKGSHLSLPYQC